MRRFMLIVCVVVLVFVAGGSQSGVVFLVVCVRLFNVAAVFSSGNERRVWLTSARFPH